MKKTKLIIFIILFVLLSIPRCMTAGVHAQGLDEAIHYEYVIAEEAVVFESIIDVETSYDSASDSIIITIEVEYEGYITPPLELVWTLVSDEASYTGTLKIKNYMLINDTTIATYTGTLYRQ
ncbi:MAG: hypothetical protein LUC95_05760 [Lachnospiraceae bacterium]|nr:hypothetical protein [Lachnospiraceae bacterium]